MARLVVKSCKYQNGRVVGGGSGYKTGGDVTVISETGNKTINVNSYNFTQDPLYDLAHERLVAIVSEVERTTESTEDRPSYARGDGWTTSGYSESHPISEEIARVLKTLEQIKYLADTAASERYCLNDLRKRLSANVELETPSQVTEPLYQQLASADMAKARDLWKSIQDEKPV